MDPRECTLVQKLVAELDDARLVHATLMPLLVRPHLKFLVEKLVNSHATIAYRLAWQVDRAGGRTVRREARLLARLGARVERWIAVTDVDVELGCLKRIVRHEAGVTQRFRETLGSVRGLDENLHRELGELERTRLRIESLLHEMQTSVSAATRRDAAVLPLSTQERYRS